jgi:hypothetical protein
MGPTSTPQSLFVVQAMLIRQLLFLGFYRPNAQHSCRQCGVIFLLMFERQRVTKKSRSTGYPLVLFVMNF